MTKMKPAAFIARLAPEAIRARSEGSPLFPSVRLAQNMLETGCNLNGHFNLGGFKVGDGKPNAWWRGSVYSTATWEVIGGKRIETVAVWRSYSSVYDFYRDQDRLFATARYARVCAAQTPSAQAEALFACGYATDPDYASKLKSIMVGYGLYRFDGAEVEEAMTSDEKKAFDALAARVAKLEKRDAAPDWFVKEFGSADLNGKIGDPRFTEEGWRSLAVLLRLRK
ncbi:glycoside hydrolase family 73 protein [Cohnella soli]|uniref:Glycoside hydrolase family 73 protein n=1 Tax=Cohnella soli TaxID=425005 RepID=A0ABW0HM89_9BACL